MSMSPWVGWGITTLLSSWLGKGTNSNSAEATAEELSVTETSIGTPIPVVLGTAMLKQPLVTYFGDFRADRYTEEYGAHATFSAWPIILSLLAKWLATPVTGKTDAETDITVPLHTHPIIGGPGAFSIPSPSGSHGHATKEIAGPSYLMMLAQWLLMWLINGHALKTTIQKGFKYYLGYQMIFCMAGTGGTIRSVYLNKLQVWAAVGNDIATGPVNNDLDPAVGSTQFPPNINGSLFQIPVNNENLFGGVDEEGGFIGDLNIYLGEDNQQPDTWMSNQMNQSTVDESVRGLTPAYRNFVTMVVPTAYVGKRPNIPETWIEYQQFPNRLGLGAIGDDANPMEVIYEILVNTEWGLCEDPARIEVDTLIAIGSVLKTEGVGITVTIRSKAEAKQILDAICDHVNMVRYINPETGKLHFKLIRDDYDPATVPLLNDYNCKSVKFTRLTWKEVSGEVCIVYTSRSSLYEQISLYKHDSAVIEINDGDKDTKTIQYPYFTTMDNALWAADREGRQSGFPLASATIVGNRELYSITIGQVVRLDWPAYGITNLLLRVTNINLGDFVEGEVTVECIEDVFGLDKTQFGYSDSTDWQNSPNYPTGVQYFGYIELPWEISHSQDAFVYAMAAKPSSTTELWTILRKRDSAAEWETTSSATNWTSMGMLVYDYSDKSPVEDLIGFEVVNLYGIAETQIRSQSAGMSDLTSARKGAKLIAIGDEIIGWGTVKQLPNGHWQISNVLRGVFDTLPQYHNSGEFIYFLENGNYTNVTTGSPVMPEGFVKTEQYNIITSTASNRELPDTSKVRMVTTTQRQTRPNPPGRFRMYDGYNITETRFLTNVIGELHLTWAPRNKQQSNGCVSQDDLQDYWAGAVFEKPTGLKYVIRIYLGSALVQRIETEDTSYIVKWSDRCNASTDLTIPYTIEVGCILDNLECAQFHRRTVNWKMPIAVNGVIDAVDAEGYLAMWATNLNIVIPYSPYIAQTAIDYVDYPIFIGGTKSATQVPDSIICWDGGWLIPDGKLYHAKNATDIAEITMDPGYIFICGLSASGQGGDNTYKWDGTKLVIIA